MPDFSYYATFDESITLLRDLVESCNVYVIPDAGIFREPIARSYNEISDEVIERLRGRRALFIAGSFTKYQPKLIQRDGGAAAGTYFLSVSQGGPFIQMTLATAHLVEEKTDAGGRNG